MSGRVSGMTPARRPASPRMFPLTELQPNVVSVLAGLQHLVKVATIDSAFDALGVRHRTLGCGSQTVNCACQPLVRRRGLNGRLITLHSCGRHSAQ